MDKIFKILRKRRKSERLIIMSTIELIEKNELQHLDVMKLAGFDNLYRVRLGKFRIIYEFKNGINKIISVNKRNDQTYRNL